VRILLVRLSALGDVVTGLHVLATLRVRQPEAYVGWLVEDRFAGLLEGHPQLDALHVYPRRSGVLRGGLRLTLSLRRHRYETALDLQGNLKSGVLARLSGARRVVGLDGRHSREGNRLFVRDRVAAGPGHRNDAYWTLLDAVIGPGPRLLATLPAAAPPHGRIVFHPGVSRWLPFKRWPASSFAALGDRLATRLGTEVLVSSGPADREEANAVVGAMRTPARLADEPGLPALVRLLAGARLVVAADTGPAHLAAASGVPTVVLFGPTDPAVAAPLGPRVRSLRAGVRCSPCELRSCPDTVCMSGISVDAVESAALELLGGTS